MRADGTRTEQARLAAEIRGKVGTRKAESSWAAVYTTCQLRVRYEQAERPYRSKWGDLALTGSAASCCDDNNVVGTGTSVLNVGVLAVLLVVGLGLELLESVVCAYHRSVEGLLLLIVVLIFILYGLFFALAAVVLVASLKVEPVSCKAGVVEVLLDVTEDLSTDAGD